jgi:hypothetical protein
MLSTRRLTAPALLMLTLALASLANLATASSASAMPKPPPDDATYANQAPGPATTVVNHTGSPVWTYVVVGLAAALLALTLAWVATWVRNAHHGSASPSAG